MILRYCAVFRKVILDQVGCDFYEGFLNLCNYRHPQGGFCLFSRVFSGLFLALETILNL